jgi:hypothetical protein
MFTCEQPAFAPVGIVPQIATSCVAALARTSPAADTVAFVVSADTQVTFVYGVDPGYGQSLVTHAAGRSFTVTVSPTCMPHDEGDAPTSTVEGRVGSVVIPHAESDEHAIQRSMRRSVIVRASLVDG